MRIKQTVREVTRPLLRGVFSALARIPPKDERKLVFSSFPDATDNSWHLYVYMSRRLRNYRFVWLCASPGNVRARVAKACDTQLGNTVEVSKRWSMRGLFHFVTASHVFFTHGTYFFATGVPGQKFVNLGHGMPIKAIGYLDTWNIQNVPYCDFALSTSEKLQALMADAHGIPLRNILPFGLPRNEALIEADEDVRQKLFQTLDIPADCKLLMWLPTYRVASGQDMKHDSSVSGFLSEWEPGFLETLNAVAMQEKTYILIKLHPMDSLNNGVPHVRLSNVSLLTVGEWEKLDVDLYPVLACSSALVSDFSSVLVDYIATRKPMAVTIGSSSNYLRDTTMLVDVLYEGCFSIRDDNDFIRFVRELPARRTDSELDAFNPPQSLDASRRLTEFFGL